MTKPKLLLALAAVVVAAGGFWFWRTWEGAACPGRAEVHRAGDKHFGPDGLRRPGNSHWRVGDWDFFYADHVKPTDLAYDRMNGRTFDTGAKVWFLVARPATAVARLRVRVAELRGGWSPPD